MSNVHLTIIPPYEFGTPVGPVPIIVPSHLPVSPELFKSVLDVRVPLTIAATYAVTVHLLNRCADGTPYKISKTRAFKLFVIVHNIFLAVYSAWTFVGMVRGLHRSIDHSGGLEAFAGSFCRIRVETRGVLNTLNATSYAGSDSVGTGLELTGGLWEEALAWYGWWFYLSKFYEVVDTAIILLKGRKSSLLQTYHHSGAMLCMWAGIRFMAPPIWIFCVFNSLIHSLMYTYYTLSALHIKVPGLLKKLLTTIQITQFIIGGSSAVLYLFINLSKSVPCLSNNGEAWAVVINAVYLAPLTWLFVAFFVDSYTKRGAAKKAQKPAAVKR